MASAAMAVAIVLRQLELHDPRFDWNDNACTSVIRTAMRPAIHAVVFRSLRRT